MVTLRAARVLGTCLYAVNLLCRAIPAACPAAKLMVHACSLLYNIHKPSKAKYTRSGRSQNCDRLGRWINCWFALRPHPSSCIIVPGRQESASRLEQILSSIGHLQLNISPAWCFNLARTERITKLHHSSTQEIALAA